MKLRAFTLIELMIGIVISGFVIGTAYSVYSFANQYFIKSKSVKSSLLDYFELSSILHHDIESAEKIYKQSEYAIFLSSKKEKINYEFKNEFTLRIKNNYVDTFPIKNERIIIENIENSSLVNFLQLSNENQKLSFVKNYGAYVYIENREWQ